MVYSARERINSRSVIPGTTRLSAAFRFVTSAWGSTGAKWATGLRLLGLVLALGAVIPPSHAQNTKRLDTVRHTMADRPYDWREERPCGSCYAPICHRGLNPCGLWKGGLFCSSALFAWPLFNPQDRCGSVRAHLRAYLSSLRRTRRASPAKPVPNRTMVLGPGTGLDGEKYVWPLALV